MRHLLVSAFMALSSLFTRPQPEPPRAVPREISENGLDLIKRWEGLSLTAYVCPGGKRTIGYGHTGEYSKRSRISRAQANELLIRDVHRKELAVNRLVIVPLTQNQFDALVSFTFNLGAARLKRSTLLKKLNRGDYAGAADEFPKWRNAGGRVLEGLEFRRAEERRLFLS